MVLVLIALSLVSAFAAIIAGQGALLFACFLVITAGVVQGSQVLAALKGGSQ